MRRGHFFLETSKNRVRVDTLTLTVNAGQCPFYELNMNLNQIGFFSFEEICKSSKLSKCYSMCFRKLKNDTICSVFFLRLT